MYDVCMCVYVCMYVCMYVCIHSLTRRLWPSLTVVGNLSMMVGFGRGEEEVEG